MMIQAQDLMIAEARSETAEVARKAAEAIKREKDQVARLTLMLQQAQKQLQ